MVVDHVADDLDVDTEVLVDEDVAEATDLRPWDIGVRIRDVLGEMRCYLPNDLEIALDGVFHHGDQIGIITIRVHQRDEP